MSTPYVRHDPVDGINPTKEECTDVSSHFMYLNVVWEHFKYGTAGPSENIQ